MGIDGSEPITTGAPSSRTSSGSLTPNKRLNNWVESKNLSIDTESILAREDWRQKQKQRANEAILAAQRDLNSANRVRGAPKVAPDCRSLDDTADHSFWTQSSTTKKRRSTGCFSSFLSFCKR